MLKDKELKVKQKEVYEIEANWSKNQKEIMKSKLALTDTEADKLARDMAKNKLMCAKWNKAQVHCTTLSSS